jgi:hypothetical protein
VPLTTEGQTSPSLFDIEKCAKQDAAHDTEVVDDALGLGGRRTGQLLDLDRTDQKLGPATLGDVVYK